jgi:hypothetical protein
VGGSWKYQDAANPVVNPIVNVLTVMEDAEGVAQAITGFVRFDIGVPRATYTGVGTSWIPSFTPGWDKIVIPFSNVGYVIGYGDCFTGITSFDFAAGLQINTTYIAYYTPSLPGNYVFVWSQRVYSASGAIVRPTRAVSIQCNLFLLPEPKVSSTSLFENTASPTTPFTASPTSAPPTPSVPATDFHGFGVNTVSIGSQVYNTGSSWRYASTVTPPTLNVNIMTVYGTPGKPQLLSGFVRAVWRTPSTNPPTLTAFIPRTTPGWSSIVIPLEFEDYVLGIGQCYLNYTNTALPPQPTLATSFQLIVYYRALDETSFFLFAQPINGPNPPINPPVPYVMTCNIFINPTPLVTASAAEMALVAHVPPLPHDGSLVTQGPLAAADVATVSTIDVGDYWNFETVPPYLAPYLTFNILTITTSMTGTVQQMSSQFRFEFPLGTGTWYGRLSAIIVRATTPGWNTIAIPSPALPALLAYGKCIANNVQPRPVSGGGTTTQLM